MYVLCHAMEDDSIYPKRSYSSHFTINLLENDISHRFAIAIYIPYSEYYFCRNVFENNRKRLRWLKEITPVTNFARSDLLIMILKNSHSLIKKIRLALASKNSQLLCLTLAFASRSTAQTVTFLVCGTIQYCVTAYNSRVLWQCLCQSTDECVTDINFCQKCGQSWNYYA